MAGGLAVGIVHAIQTHSWIFLIFIILIIVVATWWKSHLKNRMEHGAVTMKILNENGLRSLVELERKIERSKIELKELDKAGDNSAANEKYTAVLMEKKRLEEIKHKIDIQPYR